LLASPAEGLLEASPASDGGLDVVRPRILQSAVNATRFSGALDAATFGDDHLAIDASSGRIRTLPTGRSASREIDVGVGRRPRAVAASARREVPSIFVADGREVVEVMLPVPSPLPTVQILKEKLLADDAPGALALFHPVQRIMFEQLYAALSADLSTHGSMLGNARIEELREERATVRIETLVRGRNGVETREMPMYLVRGAAGEWQILDY
jgi:hypothetical protein